MAYTPPPAWGSKFHGGMPATSSGTGSYQAAKPGANMPDGTPAQRNNPAPSQQTTAACPPEQKAKETPSTPQQNNNEAVNASAPETSGTAHDKAPVQNKNSSGTYSGTGTEQISHKICKIHGKNKVIDFNSKLKKAYLSDFANIHGCGGSGHASNSTIGLTICDFTKGTEDKSVTVNYAVDVEMMAILYEAAMAARMGKLQPNLPAQTQWLNSLEHLLDTWKQIQPTPNGDRLIPRQDLNTLHGILQEAKSSTPTTLGVPVFSYNMEKNNPYKIDENNFSPCSKVTISYSPFRKDGQASSYPWYISIENFDAPVTKQPNGAMSHNSKQAKNKKSAFINLSVDDFAMAMVAVERFIRLWEQVNMGPVMAEAYRRIDAARAQNN